MFAVTWAWIQNTWFASAYDNDDWVYRLLTMVQMIGVLVLALGLPPMFDSLQNADHVDNGVMVAGYVIMRVGLIALWVRVAHHDVDRRQCALTYVTTLTISQIGWIGLLVAATVDRRHVRRRRRARDRRARRAGHRRASLRHRLHGIRTTSPSDTDC